MVTRNVVLLGDSVFDNGSYISGGRNVRWQVEDSLPKGWHCTLLAVDGNTVRNIADQLARLPNDSSHLIISVGGNDAIDRMGVIDENVASIADALSRMASVSEAFHRDYRAMLQEVLKHKLPTALCTIYYPQFPDADFQRLATVGLASFNDVILLEAFRAGLPLLDLRLVCNDSADYANPIEPSIKGGEKIAAAIATLVLEHDFARSRSEVFTSARP